MLFRVFVLIESTDTDKSVYYVVYITIFYLMELLLKTFLANAGQKYTVDALVVPRRDWVELVASHSCSTVDLGPVVAQPQELQPTAHTDTHVSVLTTSSSAWSNKIHSGLLGCVIGPR